MDPPLASAAHIVITVFPSAWPCLLGSRGTSSRLNWVIGGGTMARGEYDDALADSCVTGTSVTRLPLRLG
jgi:hypothetical protein